MRIRGVMNKKLILILLATVLVFSSLFFLVSCGEEVSIDHLEIYSMPKTDYTIGESLDLRDAKIRVVYKDNTEKLVDVTASMLSGFDSQTLGKQYIKIYYENHSTVFTVNVSRSAVTGVELVIPEENLNYIEGQLLRVNGTYMQINFLDGTTEQINVTKEMCFGYDSNKLGSQIVNVNAYLDGVEYTSSFVVTVSERQLVDIEVTTIPTKQIYYVGDSDLDLSGGVLFLKYDSGYSEYLAMTDVNGKCIEGLEYDWNNAIVDNRSVVTVSYGFKTTSFSIQVKVRDVASYEIDASTIPTQMQNLALNLEGMDVIINYNNGEYEQVTLPSDKVRIEGFDNTKTGIQQVTIVFSYGGVELATKGQMNLEVTPREAETLEMVSAPTIYQDTEFDVTEFQLRVVYNNGERGETFNLNNSMIAWANDIPRTSYAEEGPQSWYIIYRSGVEITYDFEVVGLEVVDIELHNANNVIAYLGGQAVTDDVRMTITYNNGLIVEGVLLNPEMVYGYDTEKAGLHMAKVKYFDKYEEGFETDLYVTVVREISDVTIKGNYKDLYIVGQTFSAEGMILEVSYKGNGQTESIIVPADPYDDFYDEWTFTAEKGLTFTEEGTVIISLENAGLREAKTFIVTVQNRVISVGPLYYVENGVRRQVSGFEGEESYKNVGFGDVLEGVDIDLTNYRIFVDYESDDAYDDYKPVTKEMLDYNAKYTKIGERAVTIYYPDYANYTGDEFTKHTTSVNVLEKSVVGIKLLSIPDRTIYYQDETNLNGVGTEYEGMMISLEYDNGTYGPIDIKEAIAQSRLTIGSIDVREKGVKEISFSYRTLDDVRYEGSFEIEVVDSTPISMSWTLGDVPYVEVSLGSSFGVLGMGYIDNNKIKPLEELLLTIQYSGRSSAVRMELGEFYEQGMLRVEGYNANQTGMQGVRLVHVNDSSLYVTVNTKVVERTLKEINLIVNDADAEGTTDYDLKVIQGAELDLSYISLQLVFSDDAKTVLPMDGAYVYLSDKNPGGYDVNDATIGLREVTLSYLYENETVPVTKVVIFNVIEKSLVKIEINEIPKQFYVEHEDFDINQGSIMLYYDNGTTAEEPLSNASDSNPSALFYVDKSTYFDNSEFTGFSKVQSIIVRYDKCTTSFNVYMRDRRNVSVTYDEGNQYEYTYGEIGFTAQTDARISLTMMGYENYGDLEAEKSIKNYTIEYIPKSIWQSQTREDGVDYTIVPHLVGEYVIVTSYKEDTTNKEIQSIHNDFEDSSKTLVIRKKTLNVSFLKQSKVYGTATPSIYIVMSGEDGVPSSDPLNELFVVGDGLRTPSFNPENATYSSLAYLWGGEDSDGNPIPVLNEYDSPLLLDIFNIVYRDSNAVLEIVDNTNAGTYRLLVENQFVSPNYDLVFEEGVFTIEKRMVRVKPSAISYSYGTEIVPTVPFTTAKALDEDEEIISDSGLYGSEVLLGSPRIFNMSNQVGVYQFKPTDVGSLSDNNKNYIIQLDLTDNPTVTIVARNIYVKTDSVIKVYGENFITPNVKFFTDAACTIEEGAFASGDNLATIGNITYPVVVNDIAMDHTTVVGNYRYSCEIDGSGNGSHNYNVVYVSGYVEVVKRPINVIAKANTKVYGESDPVLGFDITPIANESASGIVNRDVFEGSLTRVSGENYGEYTIQLGTLNNDNYEIRFTSAIFSISRKNLYVFIAEENLSKVYDGKVPSIDTYAIYETRGDGATEYLNEEVKQFIEFSFKGESKGFGSYEVGVQVNSNNFAIALYNENGYNYEIAKKKVAITRNEFVDLPDGLEYKGSAYEFYAQINASDLQHVYNTDGSYATDDNNQPLFDDPSVTLSIQSVINQGTYTVSVVDLADKNYEIDVENTQPITFTVLPRTIRVVIKTNAENNTIEREFNNQSAYISAADYTLENLISESDVPYFNIGIYSGDKITSATDVYYDVNNGAIIGYDVRIAENSVDPNYVVELAADYKYKIVPKDVVIRIYDKYLSKAYDGVEPSMKASMFSPVSAVTGFDTNTVAFTFIREENDGRDNTCVGNYTIQVTCSDRNFNVTTQQPNYIYQITKANVSVSINAQSMEKAYDGYNFAFDVDDLTFTAYYGNSLVVHNFAHAKDGVDEYANFVEQLQYIQNAINALDAQIGLVDFAELSYAKNNITTAILKANELRNLINSANNPMQNANTIEIRTALETIISYLENAITNINNGEIETATGLYRSVSKTLMPSIKNTFDKEQSYVAFVFGTAIDNTSNQVGTHPFTVEFSDYNRNFTLLNSNKNVSVSTHTLYINVPSVQTTYGVTLETLGKIAYELYDPRTGEIITNGNFQVHNEPSIIGTFRNVGYYDIDVSNVYISEGGSIKSDNYVLLPGEVGQVIVKKAILSVKIEDVEDPNIFVYGKTVESSQFSGNYSYFAGHNIPEDTTDSDMLALIEEANAWAEANGYGDQSHSDKMRLYYGALQFEGEDEFESVLKTNAVRFNCYINGESGTQIFDTNLFDAGDYKLSATGFKADNYEIRVIPGVLTVAKRQLNLYTQNGYYEKEYGENKVDFIYTNFAGNEDANTIMVYVDNNGDGIAETEVSSLADMVWDYTVEGGEINPLDPKTAVSAEAWTFKPEMGQYELKNYEINFGTVSVMVVKAPLYCTLTPVEGSRVTSVYMSLPKEDSYNFTYTGLKNDERAEDLLTAQPTIDFMNAGEYFNAGVHTLDQVNLNTSGIVLDNYYLMVEEFQYEVTRRKVQVSLRDVAPSISTSYGQFNITPYIAEIVSNNNQGVTSANIIGGQYGYTNFVFEIMGDDVNDAIRAAFNAVAITRRTKADSVFNEQETINGSTYTEIYRYSDMYKHNISGSVDHETNTATLKLSNMSMNSTNFEFEYVPFTATVYSSITSVIAYMDQKLVASDLSLTDDQINAMIEFTIIKSSNSWTTMTVKEMLAKGILDVVGTIPNVTSINEVMSYTLTDSSYNYALKTILTDEYYTNYYYGIANASALSVTDSRTATYDYSQVGTCTMPIRFYPETTAVVYNPEFSDGVEYKKYYSTDSIVTINAEETLFNAMALEFSIRPNASVKAPKLEIGFNADINGSVISLEFNYGVVNVVTININNGGNSTSVAYNVNYGNLFDGNLHEIRAYINKESLTFIVGVDGATGELLSLDGLQLGNGNYVFNSSEDIVESSTLTLTLGGECMIRKLTLSEQGLYDGVGAHISLPIESSNVVKVTTVQDTFETTVSNLNSLFGVNRLDESYSIALFVDGESVTYNSVATSIKLASGIHFVEMALYKNGALVDYEYQYLHIVRQSIVAYTDVITGHDAKNFVPGTQLTLYSVSNDYVAQGNEDTTLVSSGAINQYGYVFASTRTHSEIYPYSYFNMSFALDPSATYDSVNRTATYLAGSYTTTIELFSNQDYGTVSSARENANAEYQGAALQITREQTANVSFGASNNAYTYTVELQYYINGKYGSYVVSSGTMDNAYEVIVYKDRNTAYYGNNGIIVSVRNLYSSNANIYEFNAGELQVDTARIFAQVYGLGDRITIYNASYEESIVRTYDYLVEGSYKGSDEALTLQKDETLTLTNNVGSALYSAYDNLVFNFNVAEGYVASADDVLNINVAESKLDGTGNGVRLVYDLANNALIFSFYWNGHKSIDQVWRLEGNVVGNHKLQVMLDKKLLLAKANTYVGGDSENADLVYGNTTLTSTLGTAVVHYTGVKVIFDNEETTFYMPLYNHLGCWRIDEMNGEAFGNTNEYSGVTGLTSTPTFLPLYSYTSVESNVDNVVTVEEYMVANGANNTYKSSAITEDPII